MTTPITFYFDFSSSYSYIAQSRIAEIEQASDKKVLFRPIVLGAVFHHLSHAVPSADSVKMNYLNRDLQRLAKRMGIKYQTPPVFPYNGIEAMRIFYALESVNVDQANSFAHAVFNSAYADHLDMSSPENIELVLRQFDLDREVILSSEEFVQAKLQLKEQTQKAIEAEVFGAPTFVVGSELYWGADRIDMMIEDLSADLA